MLVLSRKKGQQAVIAGNIRVVVLSVHGDRVKLGFQGPVDVPIHREEVHDRIEQEAADKRRGLSVPAGERTEVPRSFRGT